MVVEMIVLMVLVVVVLVEVEMVVVMVNGCYVCDGKLMYSTLLTTKYIYFNRC